MAKYGAQYPYVTRIATEPKGALPTYKSDGRTIGKLNKLSLSLNMASGEIYGDDGLAEKVEEFVSGTGTLTTTDLLPADYGYITGATVDGSTGEVTDAGSDSAPLFGLGYVVVLRRSGATVYRACWLPKVQAAKPGEEANTKSSSLSLSGHDIALTIYAANNGKWRMMQDCSTLASAQAWILQKAGAGQAYTVTIAKSGSGEVEPLGTVCAASGTSLEISVGTPTKLYDNGEDKTSAVASGKYTVASIAADHEITVVYSA